MKKSLLSVALLASAYIAGVGCSGSGGSTAASSGGGATSTTISGTLSTSRSGGQNIVQSGGNSAFAVTLSDLEIYGICFSTPPAIATANVGSDGKFSITLACAPGNAVSGVFRNKTDGAEVGTIKFVDSSKKDISGNAKESTTITLTGDTDFGAISIDSSGNVKIPVSQISSTASTTTVAASTAFDFTGVWQIAAFDGTLPTGYQNAQPSGSNQKGPPEGFKLSVIRFAGKEFTPTSGQCTIASNGSGTCNGTAGTTDNYAMQIWMGDATTTNESALKSCNYNTGFTVEEAKSVGIDLSGTTPTIAGQTLNFARITFANPTGWGDGSCTGAGGDGVLGCDRPWMKENATAMWNVTNCTQVNKTGADGKTYTFGSCKMTKASNPDVYSAHLMSGGGGCYDSNGKGIRVDNWNNTPTNCTQVAHTVTGMTKHTCTYTNQVPYSGATAINYTCEHVGGSFQESALTNAFTGDQSGYTSETLVAQGAACKGIAAANELYRLQCYAQNYTGGGGDINCAENIGINWSATTPAAFEIKDDRGKPKSQFITNIATYSPDGSTVFVDDEEEGVAFVANNGNNQACRFARTTKIAMKKISDTKLLWDLSESGRLISTDAACRAALTDVDSNGNCKSNSPYTWLCEEVQPARWLFYTNKQ